MDFFSQVMKTPTPIESASRLQEDSYPTYPTPSPALSPEKGTAGQLGLPEIGHDDCSKKAKAPRSSQTSNGNLVTLDENDGEEGPKKKSPRLDEPQINVAVVDDEPGDDVEEGGEGGNSEDEEGGEVNPWDESCLPEDAVSLLQQVLFLLQSFCSISSAGSV